MFLALCAQSRVAMVSSMACWEEDIVAMIDVFACGTIEWRKRDVCYIPDCALQFFLSIFYTSGLFSAVNHSISLLFNE